MPGWANADPYASWMADLQTGFFTHFTGHTPFGAPARRELAVQSVPLAEVNFIGLFVAVTIRV